MNPKSIIKSKTFWANVAALALTYSGYLPAEYAAIAVPVLNLVLRYLTTQPVTVL